MSMRFSWPRTLGWNSGVPLAIAWLAVAGVCLQAIGTSRLVDGVLLMAFGTAGLGAGWLLARTGATNTQAAIGLAVGGAVIVLARLGGLDLRLAAVVVEASATNARAAASGLAASTPIPLMSLVFLGDAASLVNRIFVWAIESLRGRAPVDPVALNFVWGFALLAVGAWTGWIQRRYSNAAIAMAPVLTISAILAKASTGYPATVLLQVSGMLVLLAFGAHAARELRWETNHIDYSEDIRLDLGIAATLVIMLIVAVAAVVPAVSWTDVVSSTRSLFERIVFVRDAPLTAHDQSGPSAPAGSAAIPLPFEPLRAAGLPRQHLIGSGPELAHEAVMQIRVLDVPATASAQPYWRGLTFDQYTGHGWVSSHVDATAFRADAALYDSDVPDRLAWRQAVTTVVDLGDVIYAAGDLNSVNQPFSVGRRSADDVFGALTRERSYTVQSFVPAVGMATLERSSSEYPDWVRARYLDVPADVPARVIALARDLTATAPDPYARAHAIESYLRTYTYTLDLPAPPVNRDIVDYFLFDLRRGYCDYYASAMVMLARAAGLPARLAVGYAPGTYDAGTNLYMVTGADAHAWPELYFAGTGWVAFEPTAGRPPLLREPGVVSPTVRDVPRIEIPIGDIGALLRLAAQICAGIAGLIAAAVFAWLVSDEWHLRRLPPRARTIAMYERLKTAGRAINLPMLDSDTPYEVGARVDQQLAQLSLEADAAFVHRLIAEYVEAAFSTHEIAETTGMSSWRLRRLAWRARFRHLIERARAALPDFARADAP